MSNLLQTSHSQGSLKQIRHLTQPAVAHFVREVMIRHPKPPYMLPLSYAAKLYAEWLEFRGLNDIYKLRPGREFSHVLCNFDVDVVGIHPPSRLKPITRYAIPCVALYPKGLADCLEPEQGLLAKNDLHRVGTGSGPFIIPKSGLMDEKPVHDLYFVNKYIEKLLTKPQYRDIVGPA